MTDKKCDESYLKIALQPNGQLVSDAHWQFENPHEAGHALGQLMRTTIRAFEEGNENRTREEIAQKIIDGVMCMITDEFLDGDDSDRIVEH